MVYADGSGRRAHVMEFSLTFERFIRAKKIASTEEQKSWVHNNFCPLLLRRFAAVPSVERGQLAALAPGPASYPGDWQAECRDPK